MKTKTLHCERQKIAGRWVVRIRILKMEKGVGKGKRISPAIKILYDEKQTKR